MSVTDEGVVMVGTPTGVTGSVCVTGPHHEPITEVGSPVGAITEGPLNRYGSNGSRPWNDRSERELMLQRKRLHERAHSTARQPASREHTPTVVDLQ